MLRPSASLISTFDRPSTERIDLPHDRAERVLYDFLGIRGVSRDPQGQAIGPVTVGAEKFFRRPRLSRGKRAHQLTVTIHPFLPLPDHHVLSLTVTSKRRARSDSEDDATVTYFVWSPRGGGM